MSDSNKITTEEIEQLPGYELVMIISPEVAEEQFEGAINSVSQFITGKGGTVSDIERWGKKRLAYPIRHFGEGSYVLTRFRLPPAHNKELEANLRISEDILRHMLIKLDN